MKKSPWPDWINPAAKKALMALARNIREFEKKFGKIGPGNPTCKEIDAVVAPMIRAPGFHPGGCGLDSHLPHQIKAGEGEA